MAKDLKALLMEVDKMFPFSKRKLSTYNYSLGKFPSGWNFKVVNNRYTWSDKQLQHEFGLYAQPEFAVQAFLDYVKKNKINVRRLCHA